MSLIKSIQERSSKILLNLKKTQTLKPESASDGSGLRKIPFHLTVINKIVKQPSISTPTKVLCTHDKKFHCDDVLSTVFIKMIPEFENSIILRVPVYEKNFSSCDIVYDVGLIYDEQKNFFDHHQKTFKETFSNEYKTTLSSCGLIWKHYGKKILQNITKEEICETSLCKLHVKIYDSFVEHIDAIDNGISVCEGEPRYKVTTTLSSRVTRLNPTSYDKQTHEGFNKAFIKACMMVQKEFFESIEFYVDKYIPSYENVGRILMRRKELDSCGRIIEFTDPYWGWLEHLIYHEQQNGCVGEVLYGIYFHRNCWYGKCVGKSTKNIFDNRLPYPKEWRGLSGQALVDVCDVEKAIFCHKGGFLACNKEKEGLIKMCKKSIEQLKL